MLSGLDGADNPTSINKSGKMLVDAVNATRRRRKMVSTEEMRAVLEERDTAVTKVRVKGHGHKVKVKVKVKCQGWR